MPEAGPGAGRKGQGKGRKGTGDKGKGKGGKSLDHVGVDVGAEEQVAVLPAAQAGEEEGWMGAQYVLLRELPN